MKDINIKYLISNEQDSSWGLTINTVGFQSIPPGVEYPPRNHPDNYLFSTQTGRVLQEYQLLYISKGKGFFESTSHKRTSIKGGDMILLFPNEWHSYRPEKNTGWDESWIGFKGENINKRVLNGFFSKEKTIFHIGVREEVVHLYKQATQVAREQRTGYQQMLSGIVNYLLGYAYSQDRQAVSDDTEMSNRINKAKIIMLNNLQKGVSPEDIAKQINISYSWFRRAFKQQTGFSPAQYIQELRIQRSKELLVNSKMNSQEIAFEVGFENPEYFCYVFKKRTGKTPIKYREKIFNSLSD